MISYSQLTAGGLWVTTVEGGKYAEDPAPSRYGVSLKYHPELTQADILSMTQTRAAGILTSSTYWPPAWNALPAYLLKPMLAFSVLDGPGHAALTLQAALGVAQDGAIGPATITAATAADAIDPVDGLLRRLVEAQCTRLKESPRWLLDGVGWIGRCAAGAVAGAIDYVQQSQLETRP